MSSRPTWARLHYIACLKMEKKNPLVSANPMPAPNPTLRAAP